MNTKQIQCLFLYEGNKYQKADCLDGSSLSQHGQHSSHVPGGDSGLLVVQTTD